ncbi:MAG: hypothetical protein M3R24_24985 [Chloroflexota bacterium]|nr:hypothetical protein [Chloroflexota bacterium]
MQYFNNARLEWHPANPDPYRILLGRIGEERLKQLGQQDLSLHGKESKQDCRIFDTTRHKVCGGFLAYWRSHGLRLDDNERVSEQESIALLGLPLTAVQQEVDLSGKTVRTQWFERAQLIERNGVITRAPLGEHVMPPTEELSPFAGPPATPPVRVPPLGQAEPPVTQPTGPSPGPVRYDTFPAPPCNREVPVPTGGLQLWAYTEGDDMVVCAWLILEGEPVQGANITVYRHHEAGRVLPTLSHTTGHYYGVVSFIFYVGPGGPGNPDYLEAVASYQGITYRATIVP